MIKQLIGFNELKDWYRTLKLQAGDHRGIDAFGHAQKIGFDERRVAFDRMNNQFGREVQIYISEINTQCYSLRELIDALKASDESQFTLEPISREWKDRARTDAKDTNYDDVIFIKQIHA